MLCLIHRFKAFQIGFSHLCGGVPQGITNQLFRKVTVFSQSGPSVAAGVGTDVEFDSAVYRQLFQVIVQFPQGMLVFCILFFAFPVSTENGKQVGEAESVF